MPAVKRFLKLGWFSPELFPRIVTVAFAAGVVWATLKGRIDDVQKASEENKQQLKVVLAEVRSVREEVIQGRATVIDMAERTKRIENYMDQQNLRGRVSIIP